MIYQTPISQYNMQNVQQLGQIMDEQQSYTPSINPFDTVMNVPPGYSMYQWQQELALARSQYLVRPAMAAWNLTSSSAAYAFAYSPLFSQMLPERYGAELREINGVTKWAGGTSKWATRIGNAALNIEKASSAFASGIGTAGGKAVGWGAGQLGRGLIRTGEATANYLSGGFFTSANQWIGSQFGYESGFFNKNISGYIDTAAAYANRSIDYVGELFENNSKIKEAEKILENLKKAGASKAEIREAGKALKHLRHGVHFGAKNVDKLLESGAAGLQSLTTKVGGGIGSLIGAFFNPTVLLKQAVIDRLIDFGTESYEAYNTTMDLNREILAKGGRILRFGDASSITGVDGGLTEAQRNRLVSHIDRLASEDYTVRRNDMLGMGSWSLLGGHKKYVENLKELKALLSVSTDMGMLDMSKSLDEVEKRFDTIVKAVKKMSRITGKSKGELAMALASTQQSEARFDIGDAVSSLQRKIYAATLSGASLQTVLQEAALGSQMGVQAGLGKAAGADFMVQSRNIYQRMYRRRMLDRGDIDMMGGEQGVVSGIAAGMMSVANNDVFKSQLAMFFDTKTGRMDRSRLEAYINGEDVMGHAIERNLAMSRMSINPFTGVNEAGGKLRGRMMFVDRALQHGDISMNQIVGVARQLMKENRIKYGEAQAEYMMMGYFANTMGIDKAHLIMRALKDDSLMRPDIKEMMAVSRKQTEDRYAAEYQRAAENTSFWMPVLGGLGAGAAIAKGAAAGSAGGLLGAAIGAAVGLGVHYGLKNSSTWLGFGYNRMSPEMLRIHGMYGRGRLPLDFWNDEAGIDKYKRLSRYAELAADESVFKGDLPAIPSRFNGSETYFDNIDVSSIQRQALTPYYKEGTLFKLAQEGSNFVGDISLGLKKIDLLGTTSETNHFSQGLVVHKLYQFMSGSSEVDDRTLAEYIQATPKFFKDISKNEKGMSWLIGMAKNSIYIQNPAITEDEVNKQLQDRLNKVKSIMYDTLEDKNLRDIDLYTLSNTYGFNIGGFTKNGGIWKGVKSWANKGYFKGYKDASQLSGMGEYIEHIWTIKKSKDINNPVYLALHNSGDAKKLQDFLKTTEGQKSIYKDAKAEDIIEKAKDELYKHSAISKNILFGQSKEDLFNVTQNVFNDDTAKYIALRSMSDDLAKWALLSKPKIEGLDYNKYTGKDSPKKLSDFFMLDSAIRNKVLTAKQEDTQSNSGKDSSSTATTSETGGITSDSKLNMEILKTLRQLNATLMDIGQLNGRSNVGYSNSFF